MALSDHSSIGVVLAGGLSRRMGGGDKGLLPLGPETMLGHVIRRTAPQVEALAINANGDAGRFRAFGLPVLPDPIDGFVGPLAGVLAGLRWAAVTHPGIRHVLTVSADAPFLPMDLAHRLAAGLAAATDRQPHPIAIAQSADGLHPVIGLWPVALADDLDAALRGGVRKVLDWTDRHGTVPVMFEAVTIGGDTIDPFFNANTPEDLARARRLIEAATP
jgi:molybdenum cofactor guanylyltransferase